MDIKFVLTQKQSEESFVRLAESLQTYRMKLLASGIPESLADNLVRDYHMYIITLKK